MSKVDEKSLRKAMVDLLGTNNNEEFLRLAHNKFFKEYINYCDEKYREEWKRDIEELFNYIEEEPEFFVRDAYNLMPHLYAGEFMKMIKEQRSWDEIRYKFFEQDYSETYISEISSIMLCYAKNGIEFVENIFGNKMPDFVKRIYRDAKREQSNNTTSESKTFNYEKFMINRFGTNNKEKLGERLQEELLGKYINYCTDEEKELWKTEVKEVLKDYKKGRIYKMILTSFLCVGEYMKMIAEGGNWDAIRYAFFENDFPEEYVWGICRNMLSYTNIGIEFIENIFGNKIPDIIKGLYEHAKREKEAKNNPSEPDIRDLLSKKTNERLLNLCSHCSTAAKNIELNDVIDDDLYEIEDEDDAKELAEQEVEKYLICERVIDLMFRGKSKNRIRRFLQANADDEMLSYICHTLLEYTRYGAGFIDNILDKRAIAPAKAAKASGASVQTISEVPYHEPEWFQEAKGKMLRLRPKASVIKNRGINKNLIK